MHLRRAVQSSRGGTYLIKRQLWRRRVNAFITWRGRRPVGSPPEGPRNLAHDLIRHSLVHNSSRRRSSEVSSAAFCSLNRSEGENHGSWFFNDPGLFVPRRHTGLAVPVCVCASVSQRPNTPAALTHLKSAVRLGNDSLPVVRLANPSRLMFPASCRRHRGPSEQQFGDN